MLGQLNELHELEAVANAHPPGPPFGPWLHLPSTVPPFVPSDCFLWAPPLL